MCNRWLRDVRLQNSKQGLRVRSEIAARAGYATEFSFRKAFKRTFGVAPGAYRGETNGVPGLSPVPDAASLAQ
jgi:AraC-like DNA-binding protein